MYRRLNRPPSRLGEDDVVGGLRLAYLVAAVSLLLVLSPGQAGALLALFVTVDLAATGLRMRPPTVQPERIVGIASDPATRALLRRVVPELRMRRPVATIEAQVRWRVAAEARRQIRVIT
jgi:hypothetical protein